MQGFKQHISNFSFGNDLAPFRDSNGLYGYIDSTGRVALPPTFLLAGPFRDGVAAVGLSADATGEYIEIGIIDTTGAVGTRNADLYPIKTDFLPPILPIYHDGKCILQRFYARPGLVDLAGDVIENYRGNYTTYFNLDGFAVSEGEFPPGSGNIRQSVSDINGSPVRVISNGQDLYDLNVYVDLERRVFSLVSFTNENLHYGFTNLLSSGYYVMDHPDEDNFDFCFAEFNKTQRKITKSSDYFAPYSVSHFFNDTAVKVKGEKLYLIDKSFSVISEIECSWTHGQTPLVRYTPECPYVSVCVEDISGLTFVHNLYDMEKKKWVFSKNIVSDFVYPLTETAGSLFFYVDDDANRVIRAINIADQKLISPPIFNVTNPHDGFFSAEISKGVCAYLSENMQLIYAFELAS